MVDIKWETPEPAKAGRTAGGGQYGMVVAALKENPGAWAVVATDAAPSITTYLKKRYGLEAVSRGVKKGRAAKIYARWPHLAAE